MWMHKVNVQREYDFDLDSMSADLFLIDIQKDQRADAEASIARLGGTEMRFIPIVQGRIIGLKRDPSNQQSGENVTANRLSPNDIRQRLSWERRFSYRPYLEAHEKIIAGKFWEPRGSPDPEISVDERYAEELQLGIGDQLIFDVLGQRFEAKVTSIRSTKQRYRPVSTLSRFNIIFRPGALEDAPQTFIGMVKGPPPGTARAELQRQFVEQFLNVTVIDGFDTIAEMRRRFREAQFAVSFIGGFIFLCGALILTGSIAMTKFHRLYEAAILKTLGAKKRLIIYITLIEYGVLGLLAGLIGSSAAMGLTWTFYKYELKIPWQMLPSVNLTGVAATLLLVVVVGVLASWDVMVKKPLGILRAE
jgi:putative ABC transport system permease protein